jgi:hypothetical protein
MKYKLLISIALILILNSCNSQVINKIKWEFIKENKYEIVNTDNVPLFPSTINENNKTYLTFFNDDNKVIYRYNIETSKIEDSIPIKVLPNNQVWAINYHSKDSIFVVYNASQNENYNHTGTIIMVNSKGELIKSFSLKGLPVKCDECGSIKEEHLEYISMKYGNLLFEDNNLYIQMECYNYNPGDENYNKIFHPVSASIDVTKNTAKVHPIIIPNKIYSYYPKRNEVIASCLNENSNLIIGYNNSSSVTQFDPKTNKQTYFKINSVFGDTVFSNNEFSKTQDDYTQNSHERIYYNKNKNYFLRVTRLAMSKDASPENKRNPAFGITIFNNSYEILGEGLLEAGLSPICYFTENGICFWDKSKTKKENSNVIYFKEYKVSFENSTKKEILNDIPKLNNSVNLIGMDEYIKNTFNKPSNKFVSVFIPISQACKSCIDNTTLFVSENQKNKSLYLILAADKKKDIDKYMMPYKFTDKNKVWIDSTENYTKFLEPPILFGIVTFFENNKIIKELKIIPESTEIVKSEISKFLEIDYK